MIHLVQFVCRPSVAFAALVSLHATIAQASILPAPSTQTAVGSRTCFDSKCSGDDTVTAYPTSSSQGSAASSDSDANFRLTLSKTPSATALSSSNVAGGAMTATSYSSQAGANVKVDYYIQVNGPADSIRVPVLFDAHAKMNVTGGRYSGGSFAYSSVQLNLGSTDAPKDKGLPNESLINREESLYYQAGDTAGSKDSSFDYNSDIDLYTNTPYEVIFTVSASTLILADSTDTNNGGLTASTWLDPSFTLDPSLTGYSIAYSQGLATTVSAVPLPASAPMFAAALLGLAGLGYAAKRKKAYAAA